MRFDVLGPLRVRSRSELPLRRAAHRRLLSILLLEPGRTLSTDELIDRQWPVDAPRTARAALHTYLSQLRSLLDDGLIETVGRGYQLDLRGHQLDRHLFEALAGSARTALQRSAWSDVVDSADAALAVWRGAPYRELEGDDFAAPTIVSLEEQRLGLLELRAEALLALGRVETALPDLERATTEEPLRERLWELLMTARARLGRVTEALAAYHELRRTLDEVGLEPSAQLRDLEERILREDPALVPQRTRHNLPTTISSFVGRERAIAELGGLVERHRLVTVSGVGGAGKTRLAIELARRRVDDYPDGIWLVDLTSVVDPTIVPSAIATTLGIPSEAGAESSIRSVLRQRRSLMILDNCEHLVAEAARAAELLLSAGPGITVVATSRAPLRVPGEAVYPLPPLGLPDEGASSASAVLEAESVRLYAERAALVAPGFVVTDASAVHVAAICRRLAGLPLAIELVAAQASALAPAVIADRLATGIGSVFDAGHRRPSRQRAMAATIAWSEELLTDAERAVFARVSVFAGGFTTDAAAAVCSDGSLARDAVIGALARLVESSLVEAVLEDGVPVRYRLLEPIRAFAAARLADRGERPAIAGRHRDHYLHAATVLLAAPSAAALRALHDEHGNLEAALDWSVGRSDAAASATLATGLSAYWLSLRQARRAARHLRTVLAGVDLSREPGLEAQLQVSLADAEHEMGDDDAALTAARRATELTLSGSPTAVAVQARIASARYRLFVVDEDPRPAVALARDAVRLADGLGDRAAQLRARLILGHALAWNGETRRGIAEKRTALQLADEVGDPALSLSVYGSFFDVLALDGEARRTEPRRLIGEMFERFGATEAWIEHAPWPWMAYAFMQSGEWDRAEDALRIVEADHVEGYIEMWAYHLRGALRWMQGRHDEAREAVVALRSTDPAPRWYHDSFPLEAEIAAADGRLDDVHRAADEYLSVSVDASEAAMKTAVLVPVVRAEVDAALLASGTRRAWHIDRAREARDRAHDLVARCPPPWSGCLQFETPRTHLLLADAELSRATSADPSLWQSAAQAADYAYWRLYAGWRRCEALIAAGDSEGALESATALRRETERIGAAGISAGLAAILRG